MKAVSRINNLYVEVNEDEVEITLMELPHALSTDLGAKEATELMEALAGAVSTYVARIASSAIDEIEKAKRRKVNGSEVTKELMDKAITMLTESCEIAMEVQKHLEDIKALRSKVSKMLELFVRARELM